MAAAVESAPPPAHAWLLLCRGEPALAAAAYSTTYDTPAGARDSLIVSRDAPAPDPASSCTTLRLPVDAKEVVWARLISPATARRLRAGLLLQGGRDAQPAATSEIIPLDESPSAAITAADGRRDAGGWAAGFGKRGCRRRREVRASDGSASRAEWVTPCGRRS